MMMIIMMIRNFGSDISIGCPSVQTLGESQGNPTGCRMGGGTHAVLLVNQRFSWQEIAQTHNAGSVTRIAIKCKLMGFRINFLKNDLSFHYLVRCWRIIVSILTVGSISLCNCRFSCPRSFQ